MKSVFALIAGRIAGALVGATVGLAASKGVGTVTPETAANVQDVLTNAFMLAGYGISHKLFDRPKK